MLHANYSLKKLSAILLMAAAAVCSAQELATPVPSKDALEGAALGESLVKEILDSYSQGPVKEAEQVATKARERFDAIADAALSADRDKVLQFLGIDPDGPQALFYFVSFSMPLEVLRSYAIEAMWSGGTLVFRGTPPGKTVHEFVMTDLKKLAYGKGAAAHVSIDPRLYDTYKVTTVPTIVLSKVLSRVQCAGVETVSFKAGESGASYERCGEVADTEYWKITGNVTSVYAFESFNEQGDGIAQPYLRALAKGLATGTKSSKEQVPFKGAWEDIISPSDLLEAKQAREALEKNLQK